jgi:hypothetical protein
MRTRSQTRSIAENEVSNNQTNMVYYGEFAFDFDDASKHWNANKKKIENACYIYVCGYIKSKTGKKCMNKTSCGVLCHFHKNK